MRAFSEDVWAFARKNDANARFASNYYLQVLAYTAEYHFFGPRPMAWHLVSILLNASVVALVYILLVSLDAPLLAFWAALCFSLHPMHSEAVAWVAALPELLCAFFLLLTMLFYPPGVVSALVDLRRRRRSGPAMVPGRRGLSARLGFTCFKRHDSL